MNDAQEKAPAQPPCRQFTILDGMILTATIAGYLALLRGMRPLFAMFVWQLTWKGLFESPETRSLFATVGIWFIFPAVAVLTLAYLTMRWRKPRPSSRTILLEPGMIATFISSLILCLGGFLSTVPVLSTSQPYLLPLNSIVIGMAWTGISLRDRETREAGWIRSIGRVVALGWVLLGLCALCVHIMAEL